MSRSWRWTLPVLLVGLAGCGISSAPPQGAGKPATINLSLTTVPNIRSVTVSASEARFSTCSGGKAKFNTRSTPTQLGYPDGRCWVGSPDGILPIKITNTGIASHIFVNGASATPSDDGKQWSLCNLGDNAAVTCTGLDHHLPGKDQYLVQNFGPNAKDIAGLTDAPECDRAFGNRPGRCWAVQGTFQTEGIELTGPSQSTDSSTKWTIEITWMPVP